MKSYEIAALIAIAILIILFFHLAAAKGDRKRLTLVNSEGSEVYIDAEIANSSALMAKGLMGRESIGENEGMLFIFSRTAVYPFWMFNTTIPLDAIHIAENGTIVDILEMEPCGLNMMKCRLYTPKAAAKYVLEVNRGFSRKNGLAPGNSSLDVKTIYPGN